MIDSDLRATTIHKRLNCARQMFRDATIRKLVSENPFAHVRHRIGDVSERRAYIPATDALRVIEHCPNTTWKVLVALSRFAGLRTPSESLSLKWADVDWERQRITVPVPKLQHLPGRGHRIIPMFPEVRPWLERAFDEAPEGSVYVVPEKYRRRAMTAAGWANCNLRTTLEKVIRRAGVEPWPRLWHSMRASSETDLAGRFPLPVVAKWLGNTAAIAMKHYVDVTDADFKRAIVPDEKAAHKAAQQSFARRRGDTQASRPMNEKTPVLPGSANSCDILQSCLVERKGVEPSTSSLRTMRSTN